MKKKPQPQNNVISNPYKRQILCHLAQDFVLSGRLGILIVTKACFFHFQNLNL
jgi:hypothetical protein